MESYVTSVSSGGRITLPEKTCRQLGVMPNDKLVVALRGKKLKQLVLTPLR